MAAAVIRVAGTAGAPALAALRRVWAAEQDGPVGDPGFEARFRGWCERESARRISWLAEVSGEPVGMMNLAVFDRMPRPGRAPSSWGYLANAFVLAAHRNQGTGGGLLRALLAHADEQRYARIVLSPSERAIPLCRHVLDGARQGYRTTRGELGTLVPPPVVAAALADFRAEGKVLVRCPAGGRAGGA